MSRQRHNDTKLRKIVTYCAAVLALAEVVLVLVSWILAATMTGGVRSLLSSEGIRWFFGHFTDILLSPVLVWLLLLSMAGGCLWQSGLPGLATLSRPHYRQRMALRMTIILLVAYVVLTTALTAIPHALLLSATGQLFPSAFSRALVPIVAFGVVVAAVAYGLVSGHFRSMADVVASLSSGIGSCAPLFFLYVLAMQLYESLSFVFL